MNPRRKNARASSRATFAPLERAGTPACLVLFNKPFGVLAQFTDREGRATLAAHLDRPGIYPAGRLDRDSEGLLLLTDDARLQHRITHPSQRITKTYLVQVDGRLAPTALDRLLQGVMLTDGAARAVAVRACAPPQWLWPRDPPIRVRAHIPTSWLEIELDEGRNRQVRRMTASVGHPTLRLVRTRVGPFTLAGLAPGAWRSIDAARAWASLGTPTTATPESADAARAKARGRPPGTGARVPPRGHGR